MSRLYVSDFPVAGLKRIERRNIGDTRGFLSRLFCAHELALAGWVKPISQINFTFTAKKSTVRGLHFQHPPNAEMKLVSCLRGEVWDVAVDLRYGSPTYLKWQAQLLSAENGFAFLIPEGFAHGFQTLTDDVELLYCHSSAHSLQSEGSLNPTDPLLKIDWPMPITELSLRDAQSGLIGKDFEGVRI
jgi:dTDP-4-dehydrorhamnose 3,5-epimerase